MDRVVVRSSCMIFTLGIIVLLLENCIDSIFCALIIILLSPILADLLMKPVIIMFETVELLKMLPR